MAGVIDHSKESFERAEYHAFRSALDSLQARGSNSLGTYQPSASAPWNRRRALHLLKRTGFGGDPGRVTQILSINPSQAVDMLIQEALDASIPGAPAWVDATPPYPFNGQYASANNQRSGEFRTMWLDEMRRVPFRERMVLFWRNHFVVSSNNDIFAPLWYRYVTLLRQHAFGNFKDFAKAIGTDHAMLIYLDGRWNTRYNSKPQENYAREFLELFTMGIQDKNGAYNYTQNDITQLAKAFSGWNLRLRPEFDVVFDPDDFYDEDKTILGTTRNFDYEGAIDHIFEVRANEIADFMCREFYRFFVYEGVNESIIEQMKTVFLNNNFEILPVIRTLLKSEHFYDEDIMGAKIKSPLEFLSMAYLELGVQPNDNLKDSHDNWLNSLGQDPYDAPNVAGWPGYHLWLENSTITRRWDIGEEILQYSSPTYEVDVNTLIDDLGISDPNDSAELANALAEHFLAVPLPQEEAALLPEKLRQGLSESDWNMNADMAERYILDYLIYLRQLPEYNLF